MRQRPRRLPAPWLVAPAALGAGWWWVRHRSAPAVRRWSPPRRAGAVRAGDLHVRTDGHAQPVTVLLHGILGTNLTWGGAYDDLADGSRVLVPDLLGFGRSLDPGRGGHSLDAHLRALDAMLDACGAANAPLTVIGHSLGALVGLLWAQRRPSVAEVVCCNPPLFDGAQDADRRIAALGPLNKAMALDTGVARGFCRVRYRHRRSAQWLAVAMLPRLPVPVARASMTHTWDSYLGGLDIIRTADWRAALHELDGRSVPVLVLQGAADPVRSDGRIEELAARHAHVRSLLHPHAGHDLPMADPEWCKEAMRPPRGRAAVGAGPARTA